MSRLTLHFVCAALVAGLVLTSSLSAQGRRPGGGFGGRAQGLLSLVTNEAVQKEIGVTDDQKAKLTALREESQKEGEKLRTDAGLEGINFREITDEQRKKLEDIQKTITTKYTPMLKETLKPEQFERAQQISYQVAGPAAYNNPDVIKALDITKEQQEKLATVNKDFQEKQRALFAGGNADGVREAITKLREEQNAEIAKVLTAEQTEKFTKLKGKAFDVTTLFGGRGQGGGRPGGKGRPERKVD
jgi:Spy/CpxP family protein refolding chaperone